jgi:hypothetical protein
MLLRLYSDVYVSNGFGANAPKKGNALRPFVKPKDKRSIAPTPFSLKNDPDKKKSCVTSVKTMFYKL